MPIVRRIAFLLAATPSLTAYDHSALADTGPCSSIEYERAHTLSARLIFTSTRFGYIGTGQTGLLVAYFSGLPRSLEGGTGRLLFATNAGMFDSNLKPVACPWNRGANSCTQTSSPAEAIFT